MSEGNFVLYGLLVTYIIFDKKYLQFWQYCGIINKIYINQRERMLNYGKNIYEFIVREFVMSKMKNMVIVKNVNSNLVEEAIVVFKENVKIK